jgi:hypothetical protein
VRAASPYLRRAGILGHGGLGALYQAPDGTLYQMQGIAENEELQGVGRYEATQMMGTGELGEVRAGPDGRLYQWVESVDGLGNPVGFWKGLRRFVRRAIPYVTTAASFIPGAGPAVAAGVRAATPVLQRAGVLGHGGLGALYQSPDGTIYQVQGLAADEDLDGLAEDEELQGFAEDEELQGFAQDEELQGLAEDEELQGFAEGEELQGFAGEDEQLHGAGEGDELQGFAEDEELHGLESYVPDGRVNGFGQAPEIWKPIW